MDATGNRVACIEYQRSKESFEAFKARDELRCSEFGEVLWFFRTGAYGSSLDHRHYLADRARRFFKAFTDPETQRLHYQEGERPIRRALLGRDHTLEACSESSLLRAIDPPESSRSSEQLGINTSLEMQEAKSSLKRAGHGQRNREAERRALDTPAKRIAWAKRHWRTPGFDDRIIVAVKNGMRTAFEIQRWDHAQGNGMLLRIKDIEKRLRQVGF
jgi:hypothetical protein